MTTRIARLVAAEFLKLSAQPFLVPALAMTAAGTVLAEIFQPLISGRPETVWRGHHAVQLFAYGFKFGLDLAAFVLLIVTSMLFSGELDRGTLKNLLTRPIRRGELFAAKAATALALGLVLFAFVLAVAALWALGRGELGPVWDEGQYLVMRSGEEILAHARKAVGMALLPFLATGFLGLLVSSLGESSGFSVAAALVVYVFGDLVTGMLGEPLQRKIFLYYGDYAVDKLRLFAEGATTRWNPALEDRPLHLLVPLAWISAFLPPAWLAFRGRNVQG
jgi:hypothetical protein